MPSLALTPTFPSPRTFLDQIHSTVLCLRGQFAPLFCPVQVVGSSQGRGQIDHGLLCAALGKPQKGGHASWGQSSFRAQSLQGFRGYRTEKLKMRLGLSTQHQKTTTGLHGLQVNTGAHGKCLDRTPTCNPDEGAEVSVRDNVGIRAARNLQSLT